MIRKKVFISIIMLLFLSVCLFTHQVIATDSVESETDESSTENLRDLNDMFTAGDEFIEDGASGNVELMDEEGVNIAIKIGSALTTIGLITLVVVTLVIGIKYIMAGPEEMAKLKKRLIGLVIACIVIMMAYTIWNLSIQFIENNYKLGGETNQSGDQENTEENTEDDGIDEEETDIEEPEEEQPTEENEEDYSQDEQQDNNSVVSEIVMKSSLAMSVGEEQVLYATVKPISAAGQAMTWSSENEEIATVTGNSNAGTIVAKKAGKTKLIVKSESGRTAETQVNVYEKTTGVEVNAIEFTVTSYTIQVGQKMQIETNIKPVNASNKKLTFSSNNDSVASVDKNGIVKGNKGGTAWVSAIANNGIRHKVRVNVVLTTTEIPPRRLTFDSTTYKVRVGETIPLGITTYPITATSKIGWATSNKNIATISNGSVTGKKKGTVTITAKSLFNNDRLDTSTLKAACKVTVVSADDSVEINPTKIAITPTDFILYENDVMDLNVAITPQNATNTNVEWSSNSDNVKIENGRITAINPGKAVVTGQIKYGNKSVSTTCAVEVKAKVEDLGLTKTYSYQSDSLKIDQGTLEYNNAECYINTIWMKSPGNQIKKATGNTQIMSTHGYDRRFAINTAESQIISSMSKYNPFIAINCEYADTDKAGKNGMDFVSVEGGNTIIERHEYSNSQPRHNGISVNANGVTPFFDVWREDVFKLDPSYTFSAWNFPESSILVKDGQAYMGGNSNKEARTVFAMINNNTYMTMTVKKEGESAGLTLAEIKDLCISLKCKWAINLDGGARTKLYSKTTNNDSLQKLSGGTSKIYSMMYITEYNENNLAPKYSNAEKDADFPPFYSPYLNFKGRNPLSNKIDPKLGEQLVKAAKAAGATKSRPMTINSGFRPTEWQRDSLVSGLKSGDYKINWKGGLFEFRRQKNIVACPGKSPHQKGIAVDLDYRGVSIRSKSDSWLNRYKLERPMDYEPWHFQLQRKYWTKITDTMIDEDEDDEVTSP